MNDTDQAANTAELARATLRYMAQHRMAPTPENYAAAWVRSGGILASGPDPEPETRPLIRSDQPARGARTTAPMTAQVAVEAAEAVRLANRRARLMGSMTDLIETICDVVPALLEDQAWVSEPFGALRAAIRPASGMPDRGQLDQVRMQLAAGAAPQGEIATLRRDALRELKSTLTQWLDNLSALSESSGAYHQRLGDFAERIQQADGLDQLTSALAAIVADTAEARARIDDTRSGMAVTVQRAQELETRVSELSRQLNQASSQIVTDHLTGLLNRRGLEEAFRAIELESRTRGTPLALVMLDLDDFKLINDRHGHQTGDDVLRRFGDLLRRGLRPDDRAARYGGDEFAVLLPGATVESAIEVVGRLQRALAERILQAGPRSIPLTFSAGVRAVEGPTFEAAIESADDALYEAKHGGKNRVSPGKVESVPAEG